MVNYTEIANESIDLILDFQIKEGVLNVYEGFMGQFFIVLVLFVIFVTMQIRFERIGPVVVFALVVGSLYFDLLSGPFRFAAWVLVGVAALSVIWRGITKIMTPA